MESSKNNKNHKIISGIEPNYTYKGVQGSLAFDASSGQQQSSNLQNNINVQQKFVYDNNQYKPNSTLYRNETNNSNCENLRDFSQFDIQDNFKQNTPLTKISDSKYQNNTLYANLNENLSKETIMEVRLNIDSADRDIELYHDPFNYVVSFAPVVNSGVDSTIKRTELKNELKKSYKNNNNNKRRQELNNIVVEENDEHNFLLSNIIVNYENRLKRIFNPLIIRQFDNIKFIRLDNVILPRFNFLNINENIIFGNNINPDNKTFIKDDYERIKHQLSLCNRYIPNDVNFDSILFTDRFIQVEIKEIQNNYNLATNTVSTNAFVVFPDKPVGLLYWRGNPYYAAKTWKDSLLGTINKLSIKFYDSWGNPITLNTKGIDYETKLIIDTDLINCENINIVEYISEPNKKKYIINKLTEILKCFITINYNIKFKIPFYINDNYVLDDDIHFQKNLNKYSKLVINETMYEISNIYLEFDDFISKSGITSSVKNLINFQIKKNVELDEYINNVIWFNFSKDNCSEIDNNIYSLFNNYKLFGFDILNKLKIEALEIPRCKYFQNHLTFVMGMMTNELNTKFDFYV